MDSAGFTRSLSVSGDHHVREAISIVGDFEKHYIVMQNILRHKNVMTAAFS